MDQSSNSTRTLIVRLFHLAVESRKLLVFSLLCGLLFSLVGLFPPLVLRRLIQLLQEGSLVGSTLIWMALTLAGLFLLRGVFRYGYGVFSHVAAYRTLHNLLGRTYARVQALPPGAYTHRRSGALMSRTVNDVEVIEDFLAHGVPEIFLAAVMPVAMLLILFNIHFELALIVTLPLPLIAWLVYRLSGRTSRAWRKTRGRRADLVAEILDRIGGHSVIKSFVREESELQRVRQASARYRDSIERANRWSLIPAGVVEFAGGLAYLLVVAAGGHLALGGDVALADLVVFILYLGQIFQPLLRLANLNDVIQKAAASARRVFELLELPVESQAAGLVAIPSDLRWSVELDRVTFGYAPEIPVLRDVSFRAEAGEVLALVGPTGAGKTTSCNLVPRFYEPQFGAVKVGGIDVRNLALGPLRRSVAHVMQDVYLFHATIRENILVGNPEATEAQIREAAQAANAEEFILSLPQGYDTMVGERGARLSGGEKQRISIARALLKDAPILILDEATSSVDTESELEIREAITRLTRDRTVLVIAHRLFTVRNADRIVVLQEGRVVETGTHSRLIRTGDLYDRLWTAQDTSRHWQVRTTA